MSKNIFPLKGAVQHYAWGGKQFIPSLLSIENKESKPFAEYWLGVHHRGVAQIKKNDIWTNLDELTSLPFLLKILDVNQMLSIQSHPSKEQAEIGFQQENEKGIPLDAVNRVFKDNNHKPELMVALGDFWLLHGFRSLDQIKQICTTIPAFQSLQSHLTDIQSFYAYVMNLSKESCDSILNELSRYLQTVDPNIKSEPHYWAAKAFEQYGNDKGIFSIYFYNLVHLKKGEAIYQEAGIPHAYLEGQNVEIMANSDNVFRAGLTPKHIDIDLLLSHLDFTPIDPQVIKAQEKESNLFVYKSPAKEFEVHQIDLESTHQLSLHSTSSECYFCLQGEVTITTEGQELSCSGGMSFFVEEGISYTISSIADCSLFRAIVPL
jgi:mannose-6-phosphate isomerase